MLVTFLKKKPILPKTYLKAFMKSISKNLTFKQPFLQKRKRKNSNERSQRNPSTPNPKEFTYRFHFQENPEVSKSKRSVATKKNVNECSQRDNHYPTNPRFTYRFPSQEDQIRSYKKERKENVN